MIERFKVFNSILGEAMDPNDGREGFNQAWKEVGVRSFSEDPLGMSPLVARGCLHPDVSVGLLV